MTTVIDATADEGDESRNPYDGDRIELPDEQLRAATRLQRAVGKVNDRLNTIAMNIVYGEN